MDWKKEIKKLRGLGFILLGGLISILGIIYFHDNIGVTVLGYTGLGIMGFGLLLGVVDSFP